MRVRVVAEFDVEWCEQSHNVAGNLALQSRIESAVAEAMARAIGYGESNGHVHAMDKEISILRTGPVVTKLVEF
jgi:hypothetical protein